MLVIRSRLQVERPNNRTELATLSRSGLFFRIRTAMVYYLMEHDLTIRFTQLGSGRAEVVVSLTLETRTFQLEGFINILAGHGQSGPSGHGCTLEVGKERTPKVYRLNRNSLTITLPVWTSRSSKLSWLLARNREPCDSRNLSISAWPRSN
jgi:hypothetical protein